MLLIQDNFLTQHVLETTRGEHVSNLVLFLQNELVDNVKIHQPLGSNQCMYVRACMRACVCVCCSAFIKMLLCEVHCPKIRQPRKRGRERVEGEREKETKRERKSVRKREWWRGRGMELKTQRER